MLLFTKICEMFNCKVYVVIMYIKLQYTILMSRQLILLGVINSHI